MNIVYMTTMAYVIALPYVDLKHRAHVGEYPAAALSYDGDLPGRVL